MSTTEIYAIEKNGDVKAYESAQNSWLGAMHVWNFLSEKYDLGGSMMFGFKRVWKAFNAGVYKNYENVVLGSTFDHAVVMKENFDQLLISFKKYYAAHPESNFGQQIEVIEAMKEDVNVIGVAWCQTSVVDDLWDYYNEGEDECIPYNIFKGEKHWDLFDNLVEDSK